jgi:hypothetical protein
MRPRELCAPCGIAPLRWLSHLILETRLLLCQDRNADFAAHCRTPKVANEWLTALFASFLQETIHRCNLFINKDLHLAGLEPATL